MSSYALLPAEEQLGRYRLLARLGRGGMAEVFIARLHGAGGFTKLVAVKRMLPWLAKDPEIVAMFRKEGRITAHLDHPNVCQVIELDEADGQLYLAMELLRGLTWSEIVPAIPENPQETLLRFVAGVIVQAAEGLHHAHTSTEIDGRPHPIVHRDISPSNLFVTTEGVVKLLDFGVSKVLTEATATRSGMFKGKLPYMAPEQLRGESVDTRIDLFALAAVTWEAIAGHELFNRNSEHEIMVAVSEAQVPPLPGDGPAIARVDAVVRRALARDREQRTPTVRAFADELRSAIEGEPMGPAEIAAHIEAWLGPSLARRRRELADILGRLQPADRKSVAPANVDSGSTSDETSAHEPTPAPGARVRDRDAVVARTPSIPALVAPPTLDAPPIAVAPPMPVAPPVPVAPPARVAPRAPARTPPIALGLPNDDQDDDAYLNRSWILAIIITILAIAIAIVGVSDVV